MTVQHADRKQSTRQLVRRTVIGIAAFLAMTFLVGIALGDRVAHFCAWAIDALGLTGVVFGILASDALGVPIPASSFTFAAVAGQSPVTAILIVSFVTSVGAASMAYFLGPYIGRIPGLSAFLERFRPDGEVFFEKWGTWTVGVAAMTPLPFSVFCWLAGIYRMSYGRFFAATLVRAPRLLVYYGIFVLGWTSATSV